MTEPEPPTETAEADNRCLVCGRFVNEPWDHADTCEHFAPQTVHIPPREALLRDVRQGADAPAELPQGGFDAASRHPDLAEQISELLAEVMAEPPTQEVAVLESLNVHESDTDPAPDLQPGPEHWLAQILRDKLEERLAAGLDTNLADIGAHDLWVVAYETAIHDLVQATSEPTAESGVILPDGTRVPQGSEQEQTGAADQG